MNKKIVSITLATVLCMSMLAGCSKKPASGGDVVQQPDTPQVEQTAKTSLTITEPGNITPEGSVKEVIIEADGVILENAKLDKVVISPKVGDGDVTLSGVNAKNLVVNGGGKNSVHIKKSNFDNVQVKRADGAVRVVVDNESTAKELSLQSAGGILEVSGAVDNLEISRDAKDSTVSITEDAKVFAVLINATAEVSVASAIETLTLSQEAAGANVELSNKATVKTLATDVKVNITGDGAIEKAVTNNRQNIVSTIRPASTAVVEIPVSGGRPANTDGETDPVNFRPRPTPTPAPPAPAPEPEPETPAPTPAPVPKINLKVTGFTLADKEYDGLNETKVAAATATFEGVVEGDVVSLDLSTMTANIENPAIGNSKAVTLTGNARLAGKDAGKYTLTNAALSGIEGLDALKVNIIKANVVIKTTDKSATFANTAIDVSDMFEIVTATDGTASYAITAEGTTGAGSILEKNLTVTKAGDFKITVTTASTTNYNAGTATATLTVAKADAPVAPKLVETATTEANDEIVVTKGDDKVTIAIGTSLTPSHYEYLITEVGAETPSTTWTAFENASTDVANLNGATYTIQVRVKETDTHSAGKIAKLENVEINIALKVTGTVIVTSRPYASEDTSADITFEGLTVVRADGKPLGEEPKVAANADAISATFEDANAGENKAVTLSGNFTLTGDNASNYTLVEADSSVIFTDVKGTITKAAVTNEVNSSAEKSVVYGATETIDVSGLFTPATNAGAATYTVSLPDSEAGAGTIADGTSILDVTKAGKFKISLTTAASEDGNYAASTVAVDVDFTVTKGTRTLTDLVAVSETVTTMDGKITGLVATESYKYKKSTDDDSAYTTVSNVSEITGLAPATYNVILLANDLYNDSEAASVTIDKYVAPIDTSVSAVTFKNVAYNADGTYTLEVSSATFEVAEGATAVPSSVKLDVSGMTIGYAETYSNKVGEQTITLSGTATLTGEGNEKYTLTNANLSGITLKVTIEAAAVTNKAKDDNATPEIAYSADGIDVSQFFTLDANAGAATYAVTATDPAAGSLGGDGKTLNVTTAGEFAVSVTTAENSNYAAGDKVSVTLTVTKLAGPAAPSLVTAVSDADNEILLTTDSKGNITFTIGSNLSSTTYQYTTGTGDEAAWADITSGTPASVTSNEGDTVAVRVHAKETGTHKVGTEATANIIPKPAKIELTVTGTLSVESKTYDGNTDAILVYSGLALSNAANETWADSDVTLDVSGLTAAFADANVADDKTVTINSESLSISLTGDNAHLYKLSDNPLAAVLATDVKGNITKATPTITPANKTETYTGSTFDVSSLFTITEGAGTATYALAETTDASLSGTTLTVTKAGTFTVTVTTAASANYAEGTAEATLTVNKGTTATPVANDFTVTQPTADLSTGSIAATEANNSKSYQYRLSGSGGEYADLSGATALAAGKYEVIEVSSNSDLYSDSEAVTITIEDYSAPAE